MTLTPRLNPYAVAPTLMRSMMELEGAVRRSGLDAKLLHLIRLRASQINGCAFCIGMHTREAREDGEAQVRLDLLQAWRETELFDARERAALAWTEALTNLGSHAAIETAWPAVAAAFDPEEQAALSLAVVAIKGWNRIAVGFGTRPDAKLAAAA